MRKSLGILTILLALTSATILSIESYLTSKGNSLCQTTACKAVGQYLTIPESFLITAGAGFFWCVTLLLFFAQRYPVRLKKIPFLVLITAMAFDGTMIGYQYFTIQEQCILCLAVAALLIIITVFYCAAQRATIVLLCSLLAWGGGFTANSIIKMPEPKGAYARMVLHESRTAPENSYQPTTYTLIFSMECAHCLEVINYLAQRKLSPAIWRLAAIDQDQTSLDKLTTYLKQAPNDSNPFIPLQVIKRSEVNEQVFSTRALKNSTAATRIFLSNIGINNIPLLIIENHDVEKRLIVGSENIVNYFEASFSNTPQNTTSR